MEELRILHTDEGNANWKKEYFGKSMTIEGSRKDLLKYWEYAVS